jgi:hypothetical protein
MFANLNSIGRNVEIVRFRCYDRGSNPVPPLCVYEFSISIKEKKYHLNFVCVCACAPFKLPASSRRGSPTFYGGKGEVNLSIVFSYIIISLILSTIYLLTFIFLSYKVNKILSFFLTKHDKIK